MWVEAICDSYSSSLHITLRISYYGQDNVYEIIGFLVRVRQEKVYNVTVTMSGYSNIIMLVEM